MNVLSIKRSLELIDMQARMRMKSQANKLILSYLWWILEPVLLISMFYFVFEYILNRGGEDYLSFLIIGKIVFTWFSNSVTSASKSLIQNKGIIGQRAIPKWIFPLVNIQEGLYKASFALTVMVVLIIFQGHYPTVYWFQLLLLILLMYLLICGVGIFFSIFVTMAKDFSSLISLLMMCLMFSSGVFWDVNQVQDPNVQKLLFIANPLVPLIDAFRIALIKNEVIPYQNLISPLLISLFLLTLGFFVMNKLSNKITRSLFV